MLMWATKRSHKQDAGQNYVWVMGKTKKDHTLNVIRKEQLGVASLQHKIPKNVELCFCIGKGNPLCDQQIRYVHN